MGRYLYHTRINDDRLIKLKIRRTFIDVLTVGRWEKYIRSRKRLEFFVKIRVFYSAYNMS